MHSPAEPDPLRSCPGRPGPPSPARVEHAFDGLRFGVSRGIARACVSYLRAYLAYRYRVSSASLSRAQRVSTASPITRSHSPSLAYRWCDCGVTAVWASGVLSGCP